MAADLYPFQVIGAYFLAHRDRALLADEQGTGKSRQTIAAADLVGAKRIAVLCPANVRPVWEREFAQAQRMARPITTLEKLGGAPGPGVTIASFETAAALRGHKFDLMVLDEAHYLKGYSSQRSKLILGHPRTGKGLVADAARVWALTGTPVPNDPSELYPLVRSLFPAMLTMPSGRRLDRWRFKKRYCKTVQTGIGRVTVVGAQRLPELQRRLLPFLLRRIADDVLPDLPPLTIETVEVTATEALPHIDDAKLEALLRAIDAGDQAAIDRLQAQLASARRLIGLAKVQPVVDMLVAEQAKGRHKVIVYAWHVDVIAAIAAGLERYGVRVITGATTPAKRRKAIEDFQNDPAVGFFCGNIQAAGVGVTLTAACEEVIVESSWVPADNSQAIKRAHRIGQHRPVRARFVSLAGSMDVQVSAAVARKARDASTLLDVTRQKLTAEDIFA